MITKEEIKYIKSLFLKKMRTINQEFIVEGKKIFNDLLKSNYEIKNIYTKNINSNFQTITKKELQKISNLKNPDDILAIVKIPKIKFDIHLLKDNIILALDNINDPGNMGTIIRTAHWFGIKTILCSENCVSIYNPKVVQASMGSIFFITVHICNLRNTLIQYSKFHVGKEIICTSLKGISIHEVKNFKGIIVFGSESKGIQKNILDSYKKITIPGCDNKPDSINLGVSTGIVCHHFFQINN